jgi:hypothetical protein
VSVILPATGESVATDVDSDDVEHPVSKIELGAAGVSDGYVSATNPMPVDTPDDGITLLSRIGTTLDLLLIEQRGTNQLLARLCGEAGADVDGIEPGESLFADEVN